MQVVLVTVANSYHTNAHSCKGGETDDTDIEWDSYKVEQ
jgi:hypothetical protein